MGDTIRTDRLLLRPLRPSDAGPITLHVSDARLARMTASIPHPYPPGAAAAFVEAALAGRRDEEVWVIDATPVDGEELVGVIGLKPATGALGYWVGSPYWNAGYATEALGALVAHLFDARNVAALHAAVFADNLPSAAVLAKVGFREAGTRQVYSVARGEEVASRVFWFTRADWQLRGRGQGAGR